MDFGKALHIIRSGGVVTREAWNGTGLVLGVMAPPAEQGIMPFLAVRAADGSVMAWAPGNQELFAEDWTPVQAEGPIGHG